MQKCQRFFLGWTDEHSEGTFVSLGTPPRPLPKEMEQFWGPGEPNGGRLESCVELSEFNM